MEQTPNVLNIQLEFVDLCRCKMEFVHKGIRCGIRHTAFWCYAAMSRGNENGNTAFMKSWNSNEAPHWTSEAHFAFEVFLGALAILATRPLFLVQHRTLQHPQSSTFNEKYCLLQQVFNKTQGITSQFIP